MRTLLFILLTCFCINVYGQDGQFLVFKSSDGYTNILESYGQKYPDWGQSGVEQPSLSFVSEEKQKMIMGTNISLEKYNNVDKSFQTEEVAPHLGKLESSKVYLVFEKVKLKDFCFLIRPLPSVEVSFTTKPEEKSDRFYLLINANTVEEAIEREIHQTFKGFYDPSKDDEIVEANK